MGTPQRVPLQRLEPVIAEIRKGNDGRKADSIVALGKQVRHFRTRAQFSLFDLAELSGVSRAMLSKVERGEKSPTLAIIARIAGGLNMSLSDLMGAEPDQADLSLIPFAQRIVFNDPETGFQRQMLSPSHLWNGVEFLLHRIPPGQSSGILSAYKVPTEKYLVVTEGTLTVQIGEKRYPIRKGDSFYFEIKSSYLFINEGTVPCEYYLVIVKRKWSAR
jgi:transcriptional regulator with XRE-family HTH domain